MTPRFTLTSPNVNLNDSRSMTIKGCIQAINKLPGWLLWMLYSIGILAIVGIFFTPFYLRAMCPMVGDAAECRIDFYQGIDPFGTVWYNYTFYYGFSPNPIPCTSNVQCVVTPFDDFYPSCSRVNGTHGQECMSASYTQLDGDCVEGCARISVLAVLITCVTILASYTVMLIMGVCCERFEQSPEKQRILVN